MAFGYIPHHNILKNILKRFIGWPHLTRRLQAPVVLKMLSFNKNDVFLDLGCGSGHFPYEIRQLIGTCIGADISLNAIRNVAVVSENIPHLHFLAADGTVLPFKSGSVDKVILSGTLQSVPDENGLLRECQRILKKDGVLVLTVLTNHVLIRRMYESDNRFHSLLGTLNLPKNYEAFKKRYNDKWKMTKHYSLEELRTILAQNNLRILSVEFAPKKFSSIIFDLFHLLSFKYRIPFGHLLFFLILYPALLLMEKMNNRSSEGNEVLVKARKVN